MTIKTIKEPDIYLTEDERRKYSEEYRNFCMGYCGLPPSFESYVRSQEARKVDPS